MNSTLSNSTLSRSGNRAGGMLRALFAYATGPSLLLIASPAAHAVPSFSRQTGQECAACHVGGYGPQLTPYGVKFKIGGYTDSDGKSGFRLPLSGMLAGGFTHTQTKQDEPPSDNTKRNNNLTLDEASVFIAGRITKDIGSFIQTTYDGVEDKTALDQADVRIAHTFDIAGKDTVLGLSVNNNPGVQDPFNTMPVWSFPYTSSATGFGGGDAATLLNGGLEQRVVGASAYAFWGNHLYGEAGTYRALSKRLQSALGEGASGDVGHLGGTAYWRLAWMQDLHQQNFTAGVFGLNTALQPERDSGAPNNKYDDLGVDASYQFLGNRRHIFTANTSFVHESQTRNDLIANGEADHRKGHLNEFKINASYYYQQTYGLTAGRFDTRGNSDATLYADGYAHGSPDTSGYILQADWTPWGKEGSWGAPWANLRLGAQYTIFDKFNGASHNYDGSGRDAKDNNTFFLFAWTSF